MYHSCMPENYLKDRNGAIIIDGIIGAGKTTLCEYLSERLQIPYYEEIKQEDHIGLTQRMLDQFYASPKRWSLTVQMMFLNERFSNMSYHQSTRRHALFDRSIYGDEIFASTLLKRQEMDDDEYLIYQSLLKNMLSYMMKPQLLIYLDVTVDTALERIAVRNRSTEASAIPRDYMEDLRTAYENWFDAYDLSPKVRIPYNMTYDQEVMDRVVDIISKNIK